MHLFLNIECFSVREEPKRVSSHIAIANAQATIRLFSEFIQMPSLVNNKYIIYSVLKVSERNGKKQNINDSINLAFNLVNGAS